MIIANLSEGQEPEDCPYCGGSGVKQPECDHDFEYNIYPTPTKRCKKCGYKEAQDGNDGQG